MHIYDTNYNRAFRSTSMRAIRAPKPKVNEAGIVLVGKHKGESLITLPDGYLSFIQQNWSGVAADMAAAELEKRGSEFDPATESLSFGKYNGKTFQWVALNDRGYLDFLAKKMDGPVLAKALATLAVNAAPSAVGAFLGEVGARITLTEARVTMAKTCNGAYGDSRMLKLEVDGSTAVAFYTGSNDAIWALEAGSTVTLVGTVKAHDVFNYVNQTVLTRIKIS